MPYVYIYIPLLCMNIKKKKIVASKILIIWWTLRLGKLKVKLITGIFADKIYKNETLILLTIASLELCFSWLTNLVRRMKQLSFGKYHSHLYYMYKSVSCLHSSRNHPCYHDPQ